MKTRRLLILLLWINAISFSLQSQSNTKSTPKRIISWTYSDTVYTPDKWQSLLERNINKYVVSKTDTVESTGKRQEFIQFRNFKNQQFQKTINDSLSALHEKFANFENSNISFIMSYLDENLLSMTMIDDDFNNFAYHFFNYDLNSGKQLLFKDFVEASWPYKTYLKKRAQKGIHGVYEGVTDEEQIKLRNNLLSKCDGSISRRFSFDNTGFVFTLCQQCRRDKDENLLLIINYTDIKEFINPKGAIRYFIKIKKG